MAYRSRRRRSLTRFIAPLASLMILGYFGFHALNGQYGIRAHLAIEAQTIKLEGRLAERTAVRQDLETRVALLREGSMEKDMVDEYVRAQLNMVRSDEIVLFNQKY
ncbi:MAG: septum formation initiator family protein [Rhizobiaceae bacterium]